MELLHSSVSEVVLQKSERNVVGVKSYIPVQLRRISQVASTVGQAFSHRYGKRYKRTKVASNFLMLLAFTVKKVFLSKHTSIIPGEPFLKRSTSVLSKGDRLKDSGALFYFKLAQHAGPSFFDALQWQPDTNARTLAGITFELENPSKAGDTFTHRMQSQVARE